MNALLVLHERPYGNQVRHCRLRFAKALAKKLQGSQFFQCLILSAALNQRSKRVEAAEYAV